MIVDNLPVDYTAPCAYLSPVVQVTRIRGLTALGTRIVAQLKRSRRCINTVIPGPNPSERADMDSTSATPPTGIPIAERLDQIAARYNAATEGPWAIWHDLDHQGFYTVGDKASYDEVLAGALVDEAYPTAHVYITEDAEFIAHARADIPWLVEQLRSVIPDAD